MTSATALAWLNDIFGLPLLRGFLSLTTGRAIMLTLLAVAVTVYVASREKLPSPLGPERWPFLGNISNIPREKEWLTFTRWRKIYGNVMSLSIFGRSIIVLNSAEAAFDLLHKRSHKYSGRPYLAMGGELAGWDHTMAMTPYNERFRQMRRLLHEVLSSRSVQRFRPIQEQENAHFLNRLLKTPEHFVDHIRHTSGAVALKISHGYTVSNTERDPLVALVEMTTAAFSSSVTPGAFFVDFIPWLKYVPTWFPGAGFHRLAAKWREDLFAVADIAHNFTKDQVAKGVAIPSFTSAHLESHLTPETETLVKWTALSLQGGGADTIVAVITTFFLAMCLYPEVQRAAQAELDAVVGNKRLPSVADRPSLPYINAVMKEVLRWGPVAPSGVPHRLEGSQDDEYNGYRIPAGSLIIPNIWGMTHDPGFFPDPDEFRPKRFMEDEVLDVPAADPLQLVFGFGRRLCPGQHVAEQGLFLTIAMTLSTFTIEKARDSQSGEILEPSAQAEWLPGTISHPKPFLCTIKSRSARAVDLITQSVEESWA
ncbi:cytochrome P450 [Gautieria morchelliformis]|nr:cytochrome P450 [Gautieria morchelliformis]